MKTMTSKILLLGTAIALGSILAACTTASTQTSELLQSATSNTASDVVSVTSNTIQLNEQSVKITQAGNYTLSGKISNGQVIVDVGADQQVSLQLAGVDITSQSSSAILVKSGKATIELLAGTTNRLADGNYAENAEENAMLYAEEDLVIDGEGTLIITANSEDAITSKDDLMIKNGMIQIRSADDGIRGKDSLTLENGQILIQAGGDALKSDDETKGNLTLNGGTVTISAESDSVQAYHSITINGGALTIQKSEEGLESEFITINDGEFTIKATDDEINISDSASTSSNQGMMHRNGTASGRKLVINWGKVSVDAEGDGLDSNGAIEMNGGEVYVFGPTNDGNAALDYDETFTMNGGTLVAFGSNGMAMNVSAGSQNAVLIGLASQWSANSVFSLQDNSGKKLLEITPTKAYSSVLILTAALKLNANYTYSINGSKTGNFTLSQAILSTGISGGFGGGFWGGRGGFDGGKAPQMPNLSAEQQAQMEQMRTLMDKQRNGVSLTEEEKKLIENFEAQRPQRPQR